MTDEPFDLPDADVTDVTDVVSAPVAPEPHSVAIARRERRSEVIRPLDTEALVESFHEYQRLLPRLLNDADYQPIGRNKDGTPKRFKKKSAWLKIAAAFDLDVELVEVIVERDHVTGQPTRATARARAIAPSGRTMDGDGYCSIDEERFRDPKSRLKLEHDIPATASTRAKNRAISNLVAMGEVSAEEADSRGGGDASGPSHGPRYTGDPHEVGQALFVLTGSTNVSPVIDPILAAAKYMPQIVADALINAARVKTAEAAETLPELDDEAQQRLEDAS